MEFANHIRQIAFQLRSEYTAGRNIITVAETTGKAEDLKLVDDRWRL